MVIAEFPTECSVRPLPKPVPLDFPREKIERWINQEKHRKEVMRQRRQERFDYFGSDFVEEDDPGAQEAHGQAPALSEEEGQHVPGPDSSFASITDIEKKWSEFEKKLEVNFCA